MKMLSTAELAAEQRLIEAAQRDSRRFAELYDCYFDRVYAFALTRTLSRRDAEDVTAETFARVLRTLPRFEWRGVPFTAWLLPIAAHVAVDHYRRRRHETPLDELAEEPVAAWSTEIAAVEERADLFALVERLPADQRQVIVARFGQERSSQDIARALGRSEGAVKQLQYRALKTLRTWVEARHD
ncbi:MAG: RNA polymerase sigma factor [Dehalococcoidia bacterium]